MIVNMIMNIVYYVEFIEVMELAVLTGLSKWSIE
jgi:hypothetical protein